MIQIHELKKLTGGRYLVETDDGVSFPLYGKELDQFGIHEEGELSEAVIEQIMHEVLPKRAKLCAMHLLEHQDRTEYQLRKKLTDLYYPEPIIQEALDYVKHYHYIDDVRFAASYIEYRKETKSMRQLEQELFGKGISKDTIAEAVEQIEMPDEGKQILYWFEKKHYRPGEADQKEKDKMFRFLLRKGYSVQSISRVMRSDDLYE